MSKFPFSNPLKTLGTRVVPILRFSSFLYSKTNHYCGNNYGGGGGGPRKSFTSYEPFNNLGLLALFEGEEDECEEEIEENETELSISDEENADEESLSSSDDSEFFVSEICAPSLPIGQGMPTLEDLTADFSTQVGFLSTNMDLSEDIKNLIDVLPRHYQYGRARIFESINPKKLSVKCEGKNNSVKIILEFKPTEYPPLETFQVKGSSIIPSSIVDKVISVYKTEGGGNVNIHTISMIKDMVFGYYQNRGIYVVPFISFDGLDGGHIVANVIEGRVGSVKVVADDESREQKYKSEHNFSIIEQDLRTTIVEGELYNINDIIDAMYGLSETPMIRNVGVREIEREEESTDYKIFDVEFHVEELPVKRSDIDISWDLKRGKKKIPTIPRLSPKGDQIRFEHHNVGGNGMHLTSSISAENLLQPAGQLSYEIGIKRPYFFGIDDPKRSMLNFVFFNTRKLLKIPTANFGIEQPNLEYDRAGLNISLHENYSRNSRGSFSLVAESISCDPETNRIKDGPPNTISNSGSDKVFLLRGETVRDTTNLKRATILGARDLFTFDQGVGPSFYNRFMVTATRFIGLSKQTDCVKMPASLVLHGKYGNCIGDMALYNYFKLGGPFSCRGYKPGELGFARRFFEFALEIRCQLQKIDGQAYSFFEHTSSLGSSKELRGNPNEFYRLSGKGSSWGHGIKLGALRFEYAKNCNIDKGILNVHFGERF